MYNRRGHSGYSLIELMIATSIVGILMAIAVPYYSTYTQTGRRVDAQQYLMQQAMMLERNFTRLGQYPPVGDFAMTNDDHYTFSYAPDGGSAFVLTATPAGAQADDECGTMTVDQKGNTTPTLKDCWK